MEDFPDRFEALQTSFRKVFDDPEYKEAVEKAKGHWEYINYGGVEECARYQKSILEIGERYKALLTGS
jgi:hypothetical protein